MMHASITIAAPAAEPTDAAWWKALNTRIAGHVTAQAKHEAEIARLLDEMAKRHIEEAAFLKRWNAMSYQEAVAFMREREAVDA